MVNNGERSKLAVSSEVTFLGKVLERVSAGRLLVPRFQRPFVWRQKDISDLLDSVVGGYPIGSLLVWETSEEVTSLEQVGPIHVNRGDGTVGYILDGHQRVATLMGTLNFAEESQNPQFSVDWRIYCDLNSMEFSPMPRKGLGAEHFPVSSLLSTNRYLAACRGIEEKAPDKALAGNLLARADELANAFRNFQLPVTTVTEGDMDAAVTVFSRLNRKGRKIAQDQMVAALTYRESGPNLASWLDELLEGLEPLGFGGLARIFPLRVVLAAMNRDIYARDFAQLLIQDKLRQQLPAAMKIAENAVTLAIERLRDWGVTSDRMLPYGLQLVFLADFFRICPEPSDAVSKVLQRWFWVTSFTGWFAGVTSTYARQALAEMRELAAGNLDAFGGTVDLELPAKGFPERFDMRSARVRAFLLYLADLQPQSFASDGKIDPGDILAKRGRRALRRILVSSPSSELGSSPANRVFVEEDYRGRVLDKLKGRNRDMLLSHGIPEEATEYIDGQNGHELVRSRLEYLVSGEREFMAAKGVTPNPTSQISPTIRDSDEE